MAGRENFRGHQATAPLKHSDRALVVVFHGFPWSPGHGPIEAVVASQLSEVRRDFRGHQATAPLKRLIGPAHQSRCPNFRGHQATAPLKHGQVWDQVPEVFRFPWSPGHGPIEARKPIALAQRLVKFPWSPGHGPIEAIRFPLSLSLSVIFPWSPGHGPIEARASRCRQRPRS